MLTNDLHDTWGHFFIFFLEWKNKGGGYYEIFQFQVHLIMEPKVHVNKYTTFAFIFTSTRWMAHQINAMQILTCVLRGISLFFKKEKKKRGCHYTVLLIANLKRKFTAEEVPKCYLDLLYQRSSRTMLFFNV